MKNADVQYVHGRVLSENLGPAANTVEVRVVLIRAQCYFFIKLKIRAVIEALS